MIRLNYYICMTRNTAPATTGWPQKSGYLRLPGAQGRRRCLPVRNRSHRGWCAQLGPARKPAAYGVFATTVSLKQTQPRTRSKREDYEPGANARTASLKQTRVDWRDWLSESIGATGRLAQPVIVSWPARPVIVSYRSTAGSARRSRPPPARRWSPPQRFGRGWILDP